MDDDIALICSSIGFYAAAIIISVYIRITKIRLHRQIQTSGRVIPMTPFLFTLMSQRPMTGPTISPGSGLPPPPPYTIENATAPPPKAQAPPPPYST